MDGGEGGWGDGGGGGWWGGGVGGGGGMDGWMDGWMDVQERNQARKARNRCSGDDRKKAQAELKVLQRRVKQRILEIQRSECKSRNELLGNAKRMNPRRYWSLLKRTVGL